MTECRLRRSGLFSGLFLQHMQGPSGCSVHASLPGMMMAHVRIPGRSLLLPQLTYHHDDDPLIFRGRSIVSATLSAATLLFIVPSWYVSWEIPNHSSRTQGSSPWLRESGMFSPCGQCVPVIVKAKLPFPMLWHDLQL